MLNTIKYRVICGISFQFKGGHLIQAKITKKDRHGTAKVWPRTLNRGVCMYRQTIGTLNTGRLIEGGRLIQGRYIQVRLYIYIYIYIYIYKNKNT